MFNTIRSNKVNSSGINNVNDYLSIEVYDSVNNMPVPNAIVSLYKITVSGIYFERREGLQIAKYN